MNSNIINEMTFEQLKKGYVIITGCDNVEDFTEEELRAYMAEAMAE